MKRVRSGIPVGMALVALVVGAHSTYASQLNLLPMLQISGEYSDNVFFAENDKRSDTYFIVNPGIALDYASKTFVGSLAYQAGMQRYVDFDDRDNTVHRVDATAGFNLSKGWFIDATDNLFVTTDPLAFDASGDRVQRDSYTYNHFTPGIAYQFGGHGFRVSGRYDRIDVNYDSLIDSYQNGFGVTGSAKVGARSTLSVDFLEFRRHFDEQAPEFNVVDYTGRRYGVRGDRRFSPRLSASGFFGYEDRKFDLESDSRDFHSYIGEFQLIGEFPDVVSWMVGYSQRLNDLAIRGAYKVQRFTFDARRSFHERLRAEFNGYWQDSENEQINEQANYLGFRVEGQYMVAKFLNVWLGWNYTDRTTDTPALINPYTENRVSFGLTLSYGL